MNIENIRREVNNNELVETYTVDSPNISQVTNHFHIKTVQQKIDITDVFKIMLLDYLREVKRIEL